MASPVTRQGFITHRKVVCGACGSPQTIPANAVGKVPCAGCGTALRLTKGSDTLNPAPR